MGPQRAAQAVTWLLRYAQPQGLLSVGFAGGLQPHLHTGDAVFASRVLAQNVGLDSTGQMLPPAILPHAAWSRLASAAAAQAHVCGYHGPLISTAMVMVHAAAKQDLGQQYGALAVDMESYSIGCLAARAGLPFTVLRTIFDPVTEDCTLPPTVCMTPTGAWQPGRLAAYLTRHPLQLVQMPHLWRQARCAGKHLQAWLAAFLSLRDNAF
jgi:adenosylhomocysteine nucleosidase